MDSAKLPATDAATALHAKVHAPYIHTCGQVLAKTFRLDQLTPVCASVGKSVGALSAVLSRRLHLAMEPPSSLLTVPAHRSARSASSHYNSCFTACCAPGLPSRTPGCRTPRSKSRSTLLPFRLLTPPPHPTALYLRSSLAYVHIGLPSPGPPYSRRQLTALSHAPAKCQHP